MTSGSVMAGNIAKEVVTEAKHAKVESDKPATQTDGNPLLNKAHVRATLHTLKRACQGLNGRY